MWSVYRPITPVDIAYLTAHYPTDGTARRETCDPMQAMVQSGPQLGSSADQVGRWTEAPFCEVQLRPTGWVRDSVVFSVNGIGQSEHRALSRKVTARVAGGRCRRRFAW